MHIIYADEDILVVNKPAGVLSIPDGFDATIPHVRSLLEAEFGRLWIVHRLDKETSGLLVLARNATSHQILNDEFSGRLIEKTYIALVFGLFPQSIEVNIPLQVNRGRNHRTVKAEEDGKLAMTSFSFLQELNQASVIEARPHTGLTHQIRAHLYLSGFPILSDRLYFTAHSRSFSETIPIKRVALHAGKIRFYHPRDHHLVSLSVDPPDDFQETITYLTKKGIQ